MHIFLLSVISVEFDLDFLPHMNAFWSTRGVDETHIVLHNPVDFDAPDVPWFGPLFVTKWVGPFNSGTKAGHVRALWRKHVRPLGLDALYVPLDADEFPEFRTVRGVHEQRGAKLPVTYGIHQDRFARGKIGQCGSLDPDPTNPLHRQFPIARDRWSSRNVGGDPRKAMVLRGDVRYLGIHNNQSYPIHCYRQDGGRTVPIRHYKWTTQRLEKAKRRVAEWRHMPSHGHWRVSRRIVKKLEATS